MNDFDLRNANRATIRSRLFSTCNFAKISDRKILQNTFLRSCLIIIVMMLSLNNISLIAQCGPGEDNTDPSMVCNGTFVFTLSSAQDGIANFTLSDANLRQITLGTSDNCTSFDDLLFSVVPSTFDCSDIGDNNIEITVEDEQGNMTSCNTIIDIQDGTDPIAICPDPVGAPAPAWAQGESAFVTIVAGVGMLPANALVGGNSTDNCATTIETSPMTMYDCSHIGTQMVELTVEDGVGKKDMITCNVIVGPPLPTATSDSEVAQCSGTDVSVALDDYLDAASEDATYTIASSCR